MIHLSHLTINSSSLSLSLSLSLSHTHTSLSMEISAIEEDPVRRSSEEFEFWMVGNHPSSPHPNLLTADELFSDGFLLPLHFLPYAAKPPNAPDPSASICSTPPPPSAVSRRWMDIFKMKGERRKEEQRKGGNNVSSTELNINIWPFSRSKSAGNRRPRASVSMAGRKVSSAPCSRSNSRGESFKPRRCAASPGRAGLSSGVHVGRSSPVRQIRRPAKAAAEAAREKTGGRRKSGGGSGVVRGLGLNVHTCIGYRNQMGDDNNNDDGGLIYGTDPTAACNGGANGGLFSLKSLFTKKVY